MTRDEAIDKLLLCWNNGKHGPYTLTEHIEAGGWVDSLAALGLLAFERPNTAENKLEDIIRRHATAEQSQHILNAIKNDGLLIWQSDFRPPA
jgi:hypothetical protein